MKTSSPRSRRSAETKANILAVAERVFATAGLAGARMDAIAAAAGVNKALLYYYFQDKQALYEAIVEDHFRSFNDRALELLGRPGPAGEVLLQYVSLHFDFISAKQQSAPLFQQFIMSHAPRAKKMIQKYVQPRSEAMAALLERGMRSGEFRRTDPFHTAISIVALIVFYFSAAPVLQLLGHADAHSPAKLKQRKREVQDFIRHALFLQPHPVVL